jgi:nicotinamidase-related amidase
MGTPLRVTVRYLAMHSDGPDDNVEAKIWPVDERYEIDPARAALVLVDTWNKHPIRSHLEASGAIMRDRIAPLIAAVRSAGLPLFYAPSPDVVGSYPQWTRRFGGTPRPVAGPAARDWPPPELRARQGEWARYRRLPGETPAAYEGPLPEWWQWDGIADSVAPRDGDHVVANGDELHELLAERRIAFLFYVGFATNICVLHRDYGVIAMGARGFLPILLRDCTVGIETRDTLEGHLTTRLAIQDIERRFYTAESTDLIEACRALS